MIPLGILTEYDKAHNSLINLTGNYFLTIIDVKLTTDNAYNLKVFNKFKTKVDCILNKMYFLYLLSVLSLIVQAIFITMAIAAGLYYLAELVEEYTVMAKYIISWMVIATAVIHIGLLIFEELPISLNALGLVQQALHGFLLKEFPIVKVTTITFLTAVLTLIIHHYLAFKYFGLVYYSFSEVLAYFTLCLWVVPFALFVSLSANDYVLPTTGEKQPLLGDNNVLTDYLSRKSKKYSLLSFFSFAKDSILPQRNKKAF